MYEGIVAAEVDAPLLLDAAKCAEDAQAAAASAAQRIEAERRWTQLLRAKLTRAKLRKEYG